MLAFLTTAVLSTFEVEVGLISEAARVSHHRAQASSSPLPISTSIAAHESSVRALLAHDDLHNLDSSLRSEAAHGLRHTMRIHTFGPPEHGHAVAHVGATRRAEGKGLAGVHARSIPHNGHVAVEGLRRVLVLHSPSASPVGKLTTTSSSSSSSSPPSSSWIRSYHREHDRLHSPSPAQPVPRFELNAHEALAAIGVKPQSTGGAHATPIWLAHEGSLIPCWRVRVAHSAHDAHPDQIQDYWVDATGGEDSGSKQHMKSGTDPDLPNTPGAQRSARASSLMLDAAFSELRAATHAKLEGRDRHIPTANAAQDARILAARQQLWSTLSMIMEKDMQGEKGHLQLWRIVRMEQPARALKSTKARVYKQGSAPPASQLQEVTLQHLSRRETSETLDGDWFRMHSCAPENVTSHFRFDDFSTLTALALNSYLQDFSRSANDLYVRGPRCTGRPVAVADPTNGWAAYSPIDVDRGDANVLEPLGSESAQSRASERDGFAEVNAFYYLNLAFDHIANHVLGDATFCLGGTSQSCSAATGVTSPLHVYVNMLRPPSVQTSLLIDSLRRGTVGPRPPPYGTTPSDPVLYHQMERFPNAFYLKSVLTSLQQTTGGNVGDAAIIDLMLPGQRNAWTLQTHDLLGFFQGHRDISYDATVVFHEFMHAVVDHFAPTLTNSNVDTRGVNAEPGALNEAWADFFAASFFDNDGIGRYSFGSVVKETQFVQDDTESEEEQEGVLRSLTNEWHSPNDVGNEVHYDSHGVAAVLWKARIAARNRDTAGSTAEVRIRRFERIILQAIAQATRFETFDRHLQTVLNLLQNNAPGQPGEYLGGTAPGSVHAVLEAEAKKRGILGQAEKAVDVIGLGVALRRVAFAIRDPANVVPGVRFGSAAPYPLQLKLVRPSRNVEVKLTWKEYKSFGRAFGGQLGMSYARPMPLEAGVVSTTFGLLSYCPVKWRFATDTRPVRATIGRGPNLPPYTVPFQALIAEGCWDSSQPGVNTTIVVEREKLVSDQPCRDVVGYKCEPGSNRCCRLARETLPAEFVKLEIEPRCNNGTRGCWKSSSRTTYNQVTFTLPPQFEQNDATEQPLYLALVDTFEDRNGFPYIFTRSLNQENGRAPIYRYNGRAKDFNVITSAFNSQAEYDQHLQNGGVVDSKAANDSSSNSNTTTIVLATVLPLLALVASAAVVWRRRQHSTFLRSVGSPATAISADNPLALPDGAAHPVEPEMLDAKNPPITGAGAGPSTHPRTLSQMKGEDVSTV